MYLVVNVFVLPTNLCRLAKIILQRIHRKKNSLLGTRKRNHHGGQNTLVPGGQSSVAKTPEPNMPPPCTDIPPLRGYHKVPQEVKDRESTRASPHSPPSSTVKHRKMLVHFSHLPLYGCTMFYLSFQVMVIWVVFIWGLL